HHNNLNFHKPRGMVVRESINRIVLSGELQDDPNATTAKPQESQFVVFDLDLNEIERITLKPGLINTGRLFPATKPDEFVGLINHPATKQFTLYRYNLTRKSIEQWI